MKKVILIPDSFKGTMSSAEICTVMAQAVQEYYPDAQVHSVPVADGGEGSVDSFLQAVGGEKVSVPVKGPYFEEVPAFYGMLPDGVAVIEMAAAAGLPLVGERLHAEQTTTYGVGELMAHALERGCKRLVVGLGGSATNDGGCGAAAALGAVFRNAAGEAFVPVGATLAEVAEIDLSGLHPALASAELVTMCDIDNPLCGPLGAAHVFAPQKGADPAMVELLDAGLAHLADVVERCTGRDIRQLHGAGAAGGMGGGMVAFFGSTLQMGIETVLDSCWRGQIWCSPGKGSWMPSRCWARWSSAWRGGQSARAFRWWPWWATLETTLKRLTIWVCRRCSASTVWPYPSGKQSPAAKVTLH